MIIQPTLSETRLLVGGAAAPNTYSADFESTSTQYAETSEAHGRAHLLGPYTIEAWLWIESTSGGEGLLAWWDSSNTNFQSTLVYMETSTALSILVRTSAGHANGVRWTLNASTQTWVHLAITNDGSSTAAGGRFRLYEDTVDRGTGTTVLSAGSGAGLVGQKDLIGTGEKVMFANRTSGANNFPLDGKMDQLRIWNDVRTSGEVSSLWKTVLTSGHGDGLQSAYQFENDWTDLLGNYDATPINSPVFSTSVPFA